MYAVIPNFLWNFLNAILTHAWAKENAETAYREVWDELQISSNLVYSEATWRKPLQLNC